MKDRTWITPLIGKQWAPDSYGPDCFSCWGLVRHIVAIEFGDYFPVIPNDGPAQDDFMRGARRGLGWQVLPTNASASDGDIVLLREYNGRRHIGFVLRIDFGLEVLHSAGTMTDKGPVGCVVLTPLQQLRSMYAHSEIWRRSVS